MVSGSTQLCIPYVDYLQMILYDTPGVIEKKMHKLDSMMMKNVRSAAVNADCVLIVADASKVPEKVWFFCCSPVIFLVVFKLLASFFIITAGRSASRGFWKHERETTYSAGSKQERSYQTW